MLDKTINFILVALFGGQSEFKVSGKNIFLEDPEWMIF